MGQIVAAFGVSHTAMMIRSVGAADAGQASRVLKAWERARAHLETAKPDALVVISSEHLKTFFFDNFPTFCIGVGQECEGWADAGVPKYTVPVHQTLATTLLEGAVEGGFDLSFSEEFPLDHGFMAPLHFLTPRMDLPIVPLFQNCTTPPLPTLRRCYDLGFCLQSIVRERIPRLRVAVVGTGGLSHWVGVPEMGRINQEFDRQFLELVTEGHGERLAELSTERIEKEAGNGGQEIRNWATMLGMAQGARGAVLAYEPVDAWVTGIALVRMELEGDSGSQPGGGVENEGL